MKGSFQACLSGLIFVVLFSGCANGKEGLGAAAKPAVSAQLPAAAENREPDVQSRNERQMVLLFQALLQMERTNGLSISKEQAAALLPLIRKSRDDGEITAEEQNQALDILTAAQKKFYEDMAAKMKERMSGGNRKNPNHINPEERDKMIQQFKSRKDESTADPAGKNSRDEDDAHEFKGFGKSMEQQLIDLLEMKAKT
jgi:hypothetical protein